MVAGGPLAAFRTHCIVCDDCYTARRPDSQTCGPSCRKAKTRYGLAEARRRAEQRAKEEAIAAQAAETARYLSLTPEQYAAEYLFDV